MQKTTTRAAQTVIRFANALRLKEKPHTIAWDFPSTDRLRAIDCFPNEIIRKHYRAYSIHKKYQKKKRFGRNFPTLRMEKEYNNNCDVKLNQERAKRDRGQEKINT